MAVFVLLEEDAFAAHVRHIAKDAVFNASTSPSDMYIRRPLRGIQHRAGSHASIRVFRNDGTAVPLVNSSRASDREAQMSANFLLQSVSMPREEKAQIIENFGEAFGFFSGSRAHVFRFSVMLLNSIDFNWRSEWITNYENTFRGTRLVEQGARLYISFDDLLLEGYMLNTNVDQTSTDPFLVPCSFTLWVTGYEDLSLVGDTRFPGATLLDPDTGFARDSANDQQTSARTTFYDNEDEYLQRQTDPEQLRNRPGDSPGIAQTQDEIFQSCEDSIVPNLTNFEYMDDASDVVEPLYEQVGDLMGGNGAEGDAVFGAGVIEGTSLTGTGAGPSDQAIIGLSLPGGP